MSGASREAARPARAGRAGMRMSTALGLAAALTLGATAGQGGDLDAGKAKYAETCVNCHGRTGRGMASFPSIKGRDAAFIADRLVQYRAGRPVGPNSMLMMPMAADLSDADIADLAAYVSETFR